MSTLTTEALIVTGLDCNCQAVTARLGDYVCHIEATQCIGRIPLPRKTW